MCFSNSFMSAVWSRSFAEPLKAFHPAVFAGIEMACLDAVGKAKGLKACELLGGPVREDVEFAAYLFYRYAADDPRVLSDARLVDGRGKGDRALDVWGEVRSAESMAEMAEGFRKKWGFRVMKLKAGVLPPQEELKTMERMAERFKLGELILKLLRKLTLRGKGKEAVTLDRFIKLEPLIDLNLIKIHHEKGELKEEDLKEIGVELVPRQEQCKLKPNEYTPD